MDNQLAVADRLDVPYLQYDGAQLRRARPQDIDFAEAITAENMVDYYARRGSVWDGDRYKATFSDFDNFILWVGDTPAGIIRLHRQPDGIWIRGLEVTQAFWNRGLGSACVRATFDLAGRAGIDWVRVKAFAENRAIHMYEMLGFERVRTDNDLTWLHKQL